MNKFLNLDNPFFRGLTKAVDCVWLSILWFLCCIPIFTIGAANCALYYTINKSVRHGRGYTTSEFFNAFKSNFKTITPIWLLSLLGYAIISADFYLTYYMNASTLKSVMLVVFLIMAAILICWNSYLFPYVSRFENTRKASSVNAGKIALIELPWTVLLLVIFVLCIIATYILPPFAFVIPAIYMLLANFILERIFRKYMSKEDLEAEDERNRDFV